MSYKKITISGLVCTGKTTLFNGLKKRLNWPSFSVSNFFRQYSQQHNLSIEKAEEQSDKVSKSVDYAVGKMLKISGELIIEGWMAGIMADEIDDVLRVLLTCKDSERFRRFSKRERISLEEAKKIVKQREKKLLEKLKAIYGRDDIVDPNNYNFVLDTTNLSKEKMIKRVVEKITNIGDCL